MSIFQVCEVRADSNCVVDSCVKPMVCLLPFKANTAKQSHGLGRGRVGRQADNGPHPPTKAATNQTKRDGEHNTNSTMIGSDGSQSAAKSRGAIIDCFFWPLVLIDEGHGDWMRGITETGGV